MINWLNYIRGEEYWRAFWEAKLRPPDADGRSRHKRQLSIVSRLFSPFYFLPFFSFIPVEFQQRCQGNAISGCNKRGFVRNFYSDGFTGGEGESTGIDFVSIVFEIDFLNQCNETCEAKDRCEWKWNLIALWAERLRLGHVGKQGLRFLAHSLIPRTEAKSVLTSPQSADCMRLYT